VDAEEVSAQVLLRDQARLHLQGNRLAAHAFDQAQVKGLGTSAIHLHDRATARLGESDAYAFDHARVTAHGGGVNLFDQASCEASGPCHVRAFDDSTVIVGAADGAPGATLRVTPLVVYDRVTVKVASTGRPCVLLPVANEVTVDATEAPEGWWDETWRLTLELIDCGDARPEHRAWLAEVRIKSDPLFAAAERAAEWKAVPYQARGTTPLGV